MSENNEHELFSLAPGVLVETLARRDIQQVIAFLAEHNPRAVLRFLSSLHQILEQLSEMPHLGAPRRFSHRHLQGIRQWPVKDFKNYLIFYRPFASNNGLTVLRVLHASRDIAAHREQAVESEE